MSGVDERARGSGIGGNYVFDSRGVFSQNMYHPDEDRARTSQRTARKRHVRQNALHRGGKLTRAYCMYEFGTRCNHDHESPLKVSYFLHGLIFIGDNCWEREPTNLKIEVSVTTFPWDLDPVAVSLRFTLEA